MISALKLVEGAALLLGWGVTLGDGATEAGAIATTLGATTGVAVGETTAVAGGVTTVVAGRFPRDSTKNPTPVNATNAPVPIAINQVLASEAEACGTLIGFT